MKIVKRLFGLILCMAVLVNISATASALNEETQDYILYEDFEEKTLGVIPDKIGGLPVDFYQSSSNEPQNSVTVEEDKKGTKALKFNIATKTSGNTQLFVKLGESLKTGCYDISADFRFENNSRYFERFFQIWNDREQSEIFGETRTNYCYPRGASTNTLLFDLRQHKEEYFNLRYTVNMDTRKYNVYLNDRLISENNSLYRSIQSSESGINKIVWVAKYGVYNGADNDGSDTNAGIYWMDNIIVKERSAYPVGAVPENKANNVSADNAAEITFNCDLDLSTLNTDSVILYEDEKKLSPEDYTVSGANSKIIIEKKCGGFEYDKKYLVEVTKNVRAADGLTGIDTEKSKLEFSTESMTDYIEDIIKDGGIYTEGYVIDIPQNGKFRYKFVILDEDEKEYDKTPLSVGDYSARLEAADSRNGKTEVKDIAFKVVGAVAPEAHDVRITGAPETGGTLKAVYTYSDINNDPEGKTEFVWLKSTEKDGNYSVINGAVTDTYQLGTEDENCYIKCGVTPVSEKEPYRGECVYSESFIGSFAPEAKNIKITGSVKVGEMLKGEYEYFDLNGDAETGTEAFWVKDKDADGSFEELLNNQTTDSCIPGEEDINCYIRFCVIPKNEGKSSMDKKYYSEAVTAPFAPAADNLKILGTPGVGQSLGASYTYNDINGDKEGNSIIKWYINDKLASEGEKLVLTDSEQGSRVYFTVTPISENKPYEGETAVSQSVTVSKKIKTTFSGGGGGGSGGNTLPTIQPDAGKEPENNMPDTTASKNFDDVQGHWARDYIEKLSSKGIINGIDEKTFNPEGKLTRAQLASMIAKAFGMQEKAESGFYDVPKDAWYYDAVSFVSMEGIMKGDGTNFRPDDFINREEIAVTTANILRKELIDVSAKEISVSDYNEISEWAKESVSIVMAAGIMGGYTNNEFGAKNNTTRAEAAVIIMRLLNLTEGQTDENE